MPESAIQAVFDSHQGLLRGGMYVPTKTEVVTMEQFDDVHLSGMT